MSALRQSVKRRLLWIICILATGLAVAALSDWTKPAVNQLSVRYYNRAVLVGYYHYVRPVTSHFVRCRFQPTCSVYSIIAVQMYGFPKGAWLTTKRLFRCWPWVPMGTPDPVPLPPAPKSDAHNLKMPDARFGSMDSSTKDKIQGKADQAKGMVKEKTGEAIGNPDLRDRGTAERVGGKVQEKVGDIKKVFEK